jgi:ubiquinone/menaquinone biosynthesis C-methylase UbiE
MQITVENIEATCPESDVLRELLDMDGKLLLELGCGGADMTRAIATEGRDRRIIATEVDRIQLDRHLQADNPPNVEFIYAGAEKLPLDDNSVDIILMFKSLHHVPVELMGQSFAEMYRVLKPGGLVYISEPIFAGNFNEILRLFHDEQAVRLAAFEATRAAIDLGDFELLSQRFFNTVMQFENFDAFASRILQATHTEHRLSEELFAAVQKKFEDTLASDGELILPVRVDLLKKV